MLFYAGIMPARMALTVMVLTCHIAAGCPLSASFPLSRLSVCTACMWDGRHLQWLKTEFAAAGNLPGPVNGRNSNRGRSQRPL